MQAVIGLGNPGPEYAATRHNVGFALADALAQRWNIKLRLVGTRAHAGDGSLGGRDVAVVKPLTYMNRSGSVVAELLDSAGLGPADILVMVDDVALPVGMLRIRARGSSGGHNGLKSIDRAIGTSDYSRLRIGVGPVPEVEDGLADFVLDRFDDEEADVFAEFVPTMVDAVECWIAEGVETAMNRFNKRIANSE